MKEKSKGDEHEEACQRSHEIRCDGGSCERARCVESRNRPEPLGDNVGSALVGADETAPLDLRLVLGIEDKSIRNLTLAQLLPKGHAQVRWGADADMKISGC